MREIGGWAVNVRASTNGRVSVIRDPHQFRPLLNWALPRGHVPLPLLLSSLGRSSLSLQVTVGRRLAVMVLDFGRVRPATADASPRTRVARRAQAPKLPVSEKLGTALWTLLLELENMFGYLTRSLRVFVMTSDARHTSSRPVSICTVNTRWSTISLKWDAVKPARVVTQVYTSGPT